MGTDGYGCAGEHGPLHSLAMTIFGRSDGCVATCEHDFCVFGFFFSLVVDIWGLAGPRIDWLWDRGAAPAFRNACKQKVSSNVSNAIMHLSNCDT